MQCYGERVTLKARVKAGRLVVDEPTDLPEGTEIDDALHALAALDPRRSQVVELRFFAGLDVDETAEVLKVSRPMVMRDWTLARTWLFRELRQSPRVVKRD